MVLKHFLRLKKVPQVVLEDAFFSGGRHTRFEHSIGSYQIARKAIRELLKHPAFILDFSANDIREFLLAALLSSLDRYPFSSLFRDLVDDGLLPATRFSRIEFLSEQFYDDGGEDEPTLCKTIESFFPGLTVENVYGFLSLDHSGLPKRLLPLLKLLRSTIDVRAMDFPLRDSLHIGIDLRFGLSVNELLAHLDYQGSEIVVRASGVDLLEQHVLSRYWMFKRLYWNSPNRAIHSMIRFVIEALIRHDPDNPDGHRDFSYSAEPSKSKRATTKDLRIEPERASGKKPKLLEELKEHIVNAVYQCGSERDVLQAISDYFESNYKGHARVKFIGKILKDLLLPRAKPYREVLNFCRSDTTGIGRELCQAYSGMTADQRWRVLDVFTQLIYRRYNTVEFGSVIIDMPIERGLLKLGEDIRVFRSDGSLVSALVESMVLQGTNEAFRHHVERLRVFFDRETLSELEQKAGGSSSLQEALCEDLRRSVEV